MLFFYWLFLKKKNILTYPVNLALSAKSCTAIFYTDIIWGLAVSAGFLHQAP